MISFIARAAHEGEFEGDPGLGGQDGSAEDIFAHVVKTAGADMINVVEVYKGVDSYLSRPPGLA